MAFKSLDQFLKVRKAVVGLRMAWLRHRGVEIGEGSSISLTAQLIPPVQIGRFSYITFKAKVDGGANSPASGAGVTIGDNCFVGAGCVLTPGTRIGNGCIIAAGAVVQGEVPDRTIVAGNPARVIRDNIEVGSYGILPEAAENVRRTYRL